MTRGLVISGAASGVGKTTFTLGLMAALRAREMAVQPFKCGPDYIDPAFHTVAAGRASFNLDGWAMTPAQIIDLTNREADIALAEGSMGLFDGVALPGETGVGASADVAALAGWPVILVIDVSGQAQSAAAVAQGLARFRDDVQIAGVVLNKVASPRHDALVRAGFAQADIPVLGALPRQVGIELPSRHLGLVQAGETADLEALLAQAGEVVAQYCDLDAIVAAARSGQVEAAQVRPSCPPGMRIALTRVAAVSFVYPHQV